MKLLLISLCCGLVSARELTFFVKQQSSKLLDLEEKFHAVSNPKDPDYGKHLSHEQVIELQRPTAANVKLVKTHIAQFDDIVDYVAETIAGDKIVVTLKDQAAHGHLRVSELTQMPDSMSVAVDFVADTAPVSANLLSPSPVANRTTALSASTVSSSDSDPYACLQEQVNPTCLRSAYGIGETESTQAHNSQAVIVNQCYRTKDLDSFLKEYKLPALTTPGSCDV
jgi:propanediol dehydratase large subunit